MASYKNTKKVHLQLNEFSDNTGRIDLLDKQNVYTFLTFEKIEQTFAEMNINEHYFSLTLGMSHTKKILKRQAYTTL